MLINSGSWPTRKWLQNRMQPKQVLQVCSFSLYVITATRVLSIQDLQERARSHAYILSCVIVIENNGRTKTYENWKRYLFSIWKRFRWTKDALEHLHTEQSFDWKNRKIWTQIIVLYLQKTCIASSLEY